MPRHSAPPASGGRPAVDAPTADLKHFNAALAERALGQYSFVTLLGLPQLDWLEVSAATTRGLPYSAFTHLVNNTGMSDGAVLKWLQLAARTAERRKQQGRFDFVESERLLRMARIFAKALEFFEGNRDYAMEWLSTPQPAFGGASPLEVGRTEVGAREVEDLVGRLEHGVYS